jgi:uncharacterized protein
MGILAMNIVAFALPAQAYYNPLVHGGADGADLAAWVANTILFDGKMRALFSLLFGASLLLVIGRAEATGDDPIRAHMRRMGWLLAFGLTHYYLVWSGDILTLYALVGCIALLYYPLPARSLAIWGGLFIAAQTLLMAITAFGLQAAEEAARAPGATTEAVTHWRALGWEFRTLTPTELAASLERHRGGYDDVIRFQLGSNLLGPFRQLVDYGFDTLGLMLLGMAGLKNGFLTGDRPAWRYRRIGFACLVISVPAYGLIAWAVWRSGFSPASIMAWVVAAATPLRPLMAFGYAAFIILLARRGGALADRIGAVGRAAFTNYLATSLIVTFYFYGLGQFGRVGRAELWLVVLPVWAMMMLWSKPWLERFLYGPFEWLWRSLARGESQPMRKVPRRV